MYHRIIWETITIFALIALLLLWHIHYTVSAVKHTHILWKMYLLKLSLSSHRQYQATAAGSAAPGKAVNWHFNFYMGWHAHWLPQVETQRGAKFLGEVVSILQKAAFATFLITTIHRSLKPHSLLQRPAFPASPPAQTPLHTEDKELICSSFQRLLFKANSTAENTHLTNLPCFKKILHY